MTLPTIYFIYGLIVVVIVLIAAINIQPFKKVAVHYPSTDMVFYILLSLAYTGIPAREVARTEKHFFNSITLPFSLLTVFVPIVCIVSLISFWIISRLRWIVLSRAH